MQEISNDRDVDNRNYLGALQILKAVAEKNVQNAIDRNDQWDIIIAQKRLIAILKVEG